MVANLVVGSPKTVAGKFEKVVAGTLSVDFILSTHPAGIVVGKSTGSLELITREMMGGRERLGLR